MSATPAGSNVSLHLSVGKSPQLTERARAENLLVQSSEYLMQSGRMSAHLDKSKSSPASANENGPRPYLNPDGTLVIPIGSDPKYHWWKQGGQPVRKTVAELQAIEGNARS
jgi:hypothetical protein